MKAKNPKCTVGEVSRLRVIEDFLPPSDQLVLRVSDEQLAEIRRRRADPNRTLVTHNEARKRVKRLKP